MANDQNYPPWFYDSNYKDYLGAVGSAKPSKGGYAAQKRVAMLVAESELLKQKKVFIESICNLEKKLKIKDGVAKKYSSKIDCSSKQTAAGILKNTVIKDEWIESGTGVLYVWVVVEKQVY